jgi:hypothetical protein
MTYIISRWRKIFIYSQMVKIRAPFIANNTWGRSVVHSEERSEWLIMSILIWIYNDWDSIPVCRQFKVLVINTTLHMYLSVTVYNKRKGNASTPNPTKSELFWVINSEIWKPVRAILHQRLQYLFRIPYHWFPQWIRLTDYPKYRGSLFNRKLVMEKLNIGFHPL